MPNRFASAAALPGVGEAMATTSASCGIIWNDAAWMSAWNWEPIMPTLTLPSAMGALSIAPSPSCLHHESGARPPHSKLRRYGTLVVAAYVFLQDAIAFVF